MIDAVLMWTGAIVWGAMVGFCALVAFVAIPYTLLDFLSKTVAAWVFIGEGRVNLHPGWSRLGAASAFAFDHLLERECELHSGNNWLVSLVYSHPLKWRIINHWDRMDESDVEEEDA